MIADVNHARVASWLRTFRWGRIAVTAVASAALYYVVVILGNRSVKVWLATLVFALASASIAADAFLNAGAYKQTVFRRSVRALRQVRNMFKVPPTLHFLHALGMASALALTASAFASYAPATDFFTAVTVGLFATAAVIDLLIWGRHFFRHVWSETLGKLFSVSVGVVLAAVGVSVAKSTIHTINHVDPKQFVEATAFFSSVLIPGAYCMFGLGVLYLLCATQLVRTALFVLGSFCVEHLTHLAGTRTKDRLRLLGYRLWKGKRPTRNQVPRQILGQMEQISLVAKPISMACLILVTGWLGDSVAERKPLLLHYAAKALVQLEYRTGSSCMGLSDDTAVAYLENDKISKVKLVGDAFEFSAGECKLPE